MPSPCRGLLGAALVVVVLLSAAATAQPLEVVQLTPQNFEHETQAATGQTTGHWCVLFTNSSSSSSLQVAAEDAWEHLAEDEDKSTIMAKVDLSSGGAALVKRFNLSATPSAILFRDRAMYPLDPLGGTPADADKIAAAVHAFVDGGYEHQVPHAVPKESGWLDLVVEAAGHLKVAPTPMMWMGIATMAVGGVLFTGFLIAGIYYMYAPDKPADKKATAAAGKAAAAAKKDEGAAAGEGEQEEEAAVAESSGSKPSATRATRRRA